MGDILEWICPIRDCAYSYRMAPGVSFHNRRRGPWCYAHDEPMIPMESLNLQGRFNRLMAIAVSRGEDHIHLNMDMANELWEALNNTLYPTGT